MSSEAKAAKHQVLVERLSGIFERLYQGKTLDKSWLCETYAITPRTAYRDISRIAHLVDEIAPGKYRLAAALQPGLSYSQLSEFARLTDVAKLFPDADGKKLREALNHRETLLIKGNTTRNNSTVEGLLHDLKQAIARHQLVGFTYKNKARLAQPYKLINQSGLWYLAACEAERMKAFELAKIQRLLVYPQTFEVDAARLEAINEGNGIWFGERTTVVLEATPKAAGYLQRRPLFPHQQITHTHPNGGVTLSTSVTNPQLLFRWVRYWLPEIRIVSPVDWQEKFASELQQHAAQLTPA